MFDLKKYHNLTYYTMSYIHIPSYSLQPKFSPPNWYPVIFRRFSPCIVQIVTSSGDTVTTETNVIVRLKVGSCKSKV